MSVLGTLFGSLFLSGLLGSVGHCLGMCGPLMVMVGLEVRERRLSPLPGLVLYHAARLAVYALLGTAVGAVGSFIDLAAQLSSAAGVLGLVLGAGVCAVGLGYWGVLRLPQSDALGSRLSGGMVAALKQGGVWGLALMGALTGLLPCCLVYGALLVAASTAAPLAGALAMLSFGVGTVPALIAVGLGAGMLSVRTRQRLSRGSGALLVLVGLQLALRGLAEMHLAPHAQVGSLVLW